MTDAIKLSFRDLPRAANTKEKRKSHHQLGSIGTMTLASLPSKQVRSAYIFFWALLLATSPYVADGSPHKSQQVVKQPAGTQQTLRYLEYANMPPYLYQRGDSYQGTLPDTMQSLLTPLGYNVDIIVMPVERIYAEVLSDRGDIFVVHTYPGLSLADYPDEILICPATIGIVPIRYYFQSLKKSLLPREEISQLNMGVLRFANFQRGLTKAEDLRQLTRFNNSVHLFKALKARRIDVAMSDPYTMRALSFTHQSPMPFDSDVNLGTLRTHIAMTEKSQQRLGIFESLCEQAARWEEDESYIESMSFHMNALSVNTL